MIQQQVNVPQKPETDKTQSVSGFLRVLSFSRFSLPVLPEAVPAAMEWVETSKSGYKNNPDETFYMIAAC